MTTEFAKALSRNESVVGKTIVMVGDGGWVTIRAGEELTVLENFFTSRSFTTGKGIISYVFANDFEFKDVLEKPSQDAFKHECLAQFLAEAEEENKRLKEQLAGMAEINKQYEQQLKQCRDELFNMRMENARLELAALRWSVFDCPVNRDIADKLLRKLADEQQDGVQSF